MISLEEIFKRYPPTHHPENHGDKGTSHSYLDTYEVLFKKYRTKRGLRVLEIGVAGGLSLKMWKDYFSSSAKITGCDITDKWITEDIFKEFNIIISNSKVPATRLKLQEFGPFDIIIDDGDHNPWAQILTFGTAWPLLKKGGLYVIEDTPNLDAWKHEFEALGPKCEVYDLRKNKKRKDDVLITYRK